MTHDEMLYILIFLFSSSTVGIINLYNRIIYKGGCRVLINEAETVDFQQNNTKIVQFTTDL